MKKILLICHLEMSSSLLVQKMMVYAHKKRHQVMVESMTFDSSKQYLSNYDVILLSPQSRHQLTFLENIVHKQIPIGIINMKDYGTMNGQKVYEYALKLMEE